MAIFFSLVNSFNVDAYAVPANFLEIDVVNPMTTITPGKKRFTDYEVRMRVSMIMLKLTYHRHLDLRLIYLIIYKFFFVSIKVGNSFQIQLVIKIYYCSSGTNCYQGLFLYFFLFPFRY